jgi:hypothetical protein
MLQERIGIVLQIRIPRIRIFRRYNIAQDLKLFAVMAEHENNVNFLAECGIDNKVADSGLKIALAALLCPGLTVDACWSAGWIDAKRNNSLSRVIMSPCPTLGIAKNEMLAQMSAGFGSKAGKMDTLWRPKSPENTSRVMYVLAPAALTQDRDAKDLWRH